MAPEDRKRPVRKLSAGAIAVIVGVQNAAFAAIGALMWYLSGRNVADMIAISPLGIVQGAVLGGALTLIAWQAFRLFPQVSDQLVEMQADNYRFLPRGLGWPAVVAISIAAGIGEEMLLRGGLQTWLSDSIGPGLAIILASAIFALIHLAKPVITGLLFLVGIVFGTVYWATGSLLAVMIGHALYDIWALRYLHGEFLRLGIFDIFEQDDAGAEAAALVNPAERG